MTLNELAKLVHADATAKGWHESKRSPLEIHMLIVSEVAEATEAVRANMPAFYTDCDEAGQGKPEGEAVELADALIRILDYFEVNGWNAEEIVRSKLAYNRTRSHRHGGKLL